MNGLFYYMAGNPGKAEQFWHQGIETARELGATFEEGLIRFEIGRHLDDIDSLKSAGRIFEAINAKAELSRVDAQIAKLGKGHSRVDHGNASGEFEHGNDNAGRSKGQAISYKGMTRRQ